MIKKTYSKCTLGSIQEDELLSCVQAMIMSDEAYVYAQMDHEVALGLYQDKKIVIGSTHNQSIIALDSNNLQELRIFNKRMELKFVRKDHCFLWRYREDEPQNTQSYKECDYFDETHKLWGKANRDSMDSWSLLSSKRGSQIYVPSVAKKYGEKALLVRNYMEIRSAQEQLGLLQYRDARLCDIVDWAVDSKGSE